MRSEGKIAIVVVCLIVAGASVYFFRSSGEKPIELTVGQKAEQHGKGIKEDIPLPVDLTLEKNKQAEEGTKETEREETGEIVQETETQPAISTNIKVESESERSEISIDLGTPTSGPAATRPAEPQANKPVKIEINLAEQQAAKEKSIEEDENVLSKEKEKKLVHIVRPGDTLYDIAKKYYGKGELWTVIARANPLINPDKLIVGQKITIPLKEQAERTYEEPEIELPSDVDKSQLRVYRVRSGESFYTIARDELGDASRWHEIFRINKSAVGGDPRKLKAGQKIWLPKKKG